MNFIYFSPYTVVILKTKKTKLRGFGPRASYKDRATAACCRSSANFCGLRVSRGQRNRSPRSLISAVLIKLKEEAQDRTLWRTQFGRGYWPVARQTNTWLTEPDNVCNRYCVFPLGLEIIFFNIMRMSVVLLTSFKETCLGNDKTSTQRKYTDTHQCFEWDLKLEFQCSSGWVLCAF
jgi:hypothetical protein